jgi:uncharacterized protein with FMN-binding domain
VAENAPIPARIPIALGGGLAALAALTGCAATSAGGAGGHDPSGTTSALKDGTYTEDGQYQSPGGLSEVAVTVTLKDGTVTAVKVVPKAENATAQQYEAKFASGIASEVVGKKLTDLHVGAVAGSSLTAQGFAAAVSKIEQDAA